MNIPFSFKPLLAQGQKLTYSSYYSINWSKGDIFYQLCGWMGVEELWVGATSDSYYMKKKTNNLRHQKELGEFDQVGGEYIPSLIILDKEYHIVRIVWREDKQQCLHLKFAISD